MVSGRLFFLGIAILLLGLHFRFVDSFVLNEKSSSFLEAKIRKKNPPEPAPANVTFQSVDDWWAAAQSAPQPLAPRFKTLTPPNWLGWSLISVGSVLVLTCPCFRD